MGAGEAGQAVGWQTTWGPTWGPRAPALVGYQDGQGHASSCDPLNKEFVWNRLTPGPPGRSGGMQAQGWWSIRDGLTPGSLVE